MLVGKRKGGFGKLKQVTMPPKQAKPKEDIKDIVEKKAESTPKEVVPEVIVEKTVEEREESRGEPIPFPKES